MSYWRTFYHLIWSTKNREALITPDIEPRLFAYCVRKANELETMVHAINGWHDHIHMIVSVPPKVAIADLLHLVKGASSHEFKLQWQRGYGVLTLGEKQMPIAVAYVENQKTHHVATSTVAALEYVLDIDNAPHYKGVSSHFSLYASPPLREAGVMYDVTPESYF